MVTSNEKEKAPTARRLTSSTVTNAKITVSKKETPKKITEKSTAAEKPDNVKTTARKLTEEPKQAPINMEDLHDVSYEDQLKFFNAIKEVFSQYNAPHIASDENLFNELYMRSIEEVVTLAVEGNVPAQDYLTYLYKKGREGILRPSLTRAHEWGFLAIMGGSILAVDRLRLFFTPVYQYVENSEHVEEIILKNDLNEDTILPFIASAMAGIIVNELGITLRQMSKESVVPARLENVEEFMRKIETARNKNLPKLISLLRHEK